MRPVELAALILAIALPSFLTGTINAEERLKVVSYNIRQDTASDVGGRDWQARKRSLMGYLLDGDFSIIGLQEVRHNQLLDVAATLKKYAFTGVGRDDGKTKGEYSPIFFHAQTWKLDPQQHGTFWLSDTPDIVRSRTWGNRYPRICTWARLISLEQSFSGQAIYVFNTHWDHQSQASRVESAHLILEKIASRINKEDPIILMGDFNATTDNPAIKTLLSSRQVLDHGGIQKRTGSEWKKTLAEGRRIDHIFISPQFCDAVMKVESNTGVDGLSASDHHPVVLEANLPSSVSPKDET